MKNSTDDITSWQSRMLPVMVRMVVGLTVFFFLASLVQLVYLHTRIQDGPTLLSEPAQDLDAEARQRYILEIYVIDKRHHQGNVLLMSRVWTRYLGFVTGMILAIVGAVFVLGKLEAQPSDIKAETDLFKMSVRSASPGIILAALGVILMAITIITHHEIALSDRPLYTASTAGADLSLQSELEDPTDEEMSYTEEE